MAKQKTTKLPDIEIPLISNSKYNLEKFDFSFFDLHLVNIESAYFKRYIKSFATNPMFETNFSYIKKIIDEKDEKEENIYAVIKRNIKINYDQINIENVFRLLLIIFPSDLQISHRLTFREYDGLLLSEGLYSSDLPKRYPDRFLISRDNMLTEINAFIKRSFPVMRKHSYLDLSISHYIIGFTSSHIHYTLITLCMAMETTVNSTNELTYRLKRNLAIIVGEDPKSSSLIYTNVNLIYSLRSKIVHGDHFKLKKIQEYLPYLESLVSRTLIELLIHDVGLDHLNDRITEMGFGNKSI